MSIIDKFLQVSSKQAFTATAASTDVIDAGATRSATMQRDLGAGTPLFMEFAVSADFTGLTSVEFQLQDSPDNSTFTTRASTGPVLLANLKAGKKFAVWLPNGLNRYVRASYTVVGTGTGGSVNAYITDAPEHRPAYPRGD